MRTASLASLLWLGTTGLLSGCQTLFRAFDKSTANARAGIVRAKKFKDSQGTMYWSHFDATKRSAIINAKGDGSMSVLAEVTPDAAVQKTLEVLAKAKAGEQVDAETQLKTASTIAQLGQRTANVNMLRDALYRLAEGASNNPGFFYFFGSPAPAPTSATGSPASPVAPFKLGNTNINPTNNPTSGTSATCPTCGTTYERLFTLTLNTYASAVKDEAEATKAQAEAEKAKAEADKAKAELEKAKLDAKGDKQDGTATQKPPKPTAPADTVKVKTKKSEASKVKKPKS